MEDDKKGPPAQAPGNETKTDPNSVPPGVQARIDEMTAKLRETERQFNEQAQTWEQEKAEYTRLLQTRAPQAPADPIAQRLDGMEQMLRNMAQSFGYAQERQGLDFYGRVEALPDPVVERAQKLIEQEYKAGRRLDRETAITFAMGQIAREDFRKKAAAQPPLNSNPNGMLFTGPGYMPSTNNTKRGLDYPADFSRWPVKKQADWLDKNMPDVPLQPHTRS